MSTFAATELVLPRNVGLCVLDTLDAEIIPSVSKKRCMTLEDEEIRQRDTEEDLVRLYQG